MKEKGSEIGGSPSVASKKPASQAFPCGFGAKNEE